MLSNRSVPADTVLPHVTCQSVPDALTWLGRVFGFVELYRYGESGSPVSGAQVLAGNAILMLHRAGAQDTPARLGNATQYLTIFVENVDAHCERAKAEGAKIIEELHQTVYGERQYGVLDLNGHRWLFSQHVHDVSPDDWGATVNTNAKK